MNIFKLIRAIRPINLLMTLFILISVRYGILETEPINPIWFPLYSVAMIFVMAFGYLINDYYDVETDRINKPGKNIFDSDKKIEPTLFMWLSLAVGMIIPIVGFLKNYDRIVLLFIYMLSGFSLFIYAKYLKRIPFLGNLCIAILSSLSIITVYYIKTDGNAVSQIHIHLIFLYASFAFITTVIREIIKDAEDVEGDLATGISTIATTLGLKKTRYIANAFAFIAIILTSTAAYYFLKTADNLPKAISFFILVAFAAFSILKISTAHDKKQFGQASLSIKIWMLAGIITMWT